MSINPVALPFTSGLVNPPVAISNLAIEKTFAATGVVGVLNIEASADGVNWCVVHVLQAGKNDGTARFVARFIRCDATNGGATSLFVMAEDATTQSDSIPLAPANGPGAALDITTFGEQATIYCGAVGGIPGGGGGAVGLEISPDGTNWTSQYRTFNLSGCVTGDVPANFVRAVGRGGIAQLSISAQNA